MDLCKEEFKAFAYLMCAASDQRPNPARRDFVKKRVRIVDLDHLMRIIQTNRDYQNIKMLEKYARSCQLTGKVKREISAVLEGLLKLDAQRNAILSISVMFLRKLICS